MMLTFSLYAVAFTVGLCLYWLLYSGPARKFLHQGVPVQTSGRLKTYPPEAETTEHHHIKSSAGQSAAGGPGSGGQQQARRPRKAQLSEVRHPSRPAELRVITPDGVTVLGNGGGDGGEPPRLPPRRSGKPPPPPVPPSRHPRPAQTTPQAPSPAPLQVPTHSPTPTANSQAAEESSHEDKEVIALNSWTPAKSPLLSSPSGVQGAPGGCPSPELPLPPPPPPLDCCPMAGMADEPLPPPPPDLAPPEPGTGTITPDPASGARDDPLRPSSVYPKNSYMSYVSGRKASRRHGYEGNYRRPQSFSPPSRELDSLPPPTGAPPVLPPAPQPHVFLTVEAAPALPSNHLPCLSPDNSPAQFPNSFQNNVPSFKSHSNAPVSVQVLGGQSNPPSVSVPIEVEEPVQSATGESAPCRTFCYPPQENAACDSKVTRTNFPDNPRSIPDHPRPNHAESFRSSPPPETQPDPSLVTATGGEGETSRSCLSQLAKSRDSFSSKTQDPSHLDPSLVACHQPKSEPRTVPSLKSQDSPPVTKSRDSYVLLHIDIGETRAPDSLPTPSQSEVISNSASPLPELTNRKQDDVTSSPKEEEHERLSKAFAERCGDQTLRSILAPGPDRAQLWDYLEGVFTQEDLLLRNSRTHLKQQQRRQESRAPISPNYTTRSDNVIDSRDVSAPVPGNGGSGGVRAGELLPAHSAYFTTSEPKAKLLTRISQTDLWLINGQSTCATDSELGRKKEELIGSIGRKLSLLRGEQSALQEEVTQNELLGQQVALRVEQVAKVNELQKFRLHVEETEKIVNLLMSLSGRLARAQNALRELPQEAPLDERHLLEAKRDKLSSQHEEARALKESVDRRGRQVADFLRSYLGEEDFGDFVHFVAMKAKLLVDARELDDKIRLGEEQLAALERKRQHEATASVYRYDCDWNATSRRNSNNNAGATSV